MPAGGCWFSSYPGWYSILVMLLGDGRRTRGEDGIAAGFCLARGAVPRIYRRNPTHVVNAGAYADMHVWETHVHVPASSSTFPRIFSRVGRGSCCLRRLGGHWIAWLLRTDRTSKTVDVARISYTSDGTWHRDPGRDLCGALRSAALVDSRRPAGVVYSRRGFALENPAIRFRTWRSAPALRWTASSRSGPPCHKLHHIRVVLIY